MFYFALSKGCHPFVISPYSRRVNVLKGYFKLETQYTKYGNKDYEKLISEMIERDQRIRPNCEQVIKQLKKLDGDEPDSTYVIVTKSYTGNEFHNILRREFGPSLTIWKEPPHIDSMPTSSDDSKTSEFRKRSQRSSRQNDFVDVISEAGNQRDRKCVVV